MRIKKKERKKNASQFYNMFMNGSCVYVFCKRLPLI